MKLLKEVDVKKRKNLDSMIEDLEHEMIGGDPESEEYAVLLQRYERLVNLRQNAKGKIDPNTAMLVGGNLLGILAILSYEKIGIVTSKALSLLIKPKFGK